MLGVPGMNYSTLLNRSSDWEGAYGEIAYATYPDKIDQQLAFGLLQMLWDRAEGNGYAHHMTRDPLPNTPPHQVLLQVAFSDHQVANVTAEVEARTIGAFLHSPAVPDGLHWSVDPNFGLPPVAGDATAGGLVPRLLVERRPGPRRRRRTATCRPPSATTRTRTPAATTPAPTRCATSC